MNAFLSPLTGSQAEAGGKRRFTHTQRENGVEDFCYKRTHAVFFSKKIGFQEQHFVFVYKNDAFIVCEWYCDTVILDIKSFIATLKTKMP